MDSPKPPRRRLRLWQLITGSLLALVIMLVSFAFMLRASGAAELTRTIADLTARGYPMTVEALRAGVAGGDPMVHEMYERWRASRTGKGDEFVKAAYDPAWFDWIDRGESAPQRLRDLVAAHTAGFDDLRTAIRTDRLRVGSAARLGQVLKDGASPTRFDYSPNLLNLREAAHFLRPSALAGDPQAFADLLGLVDALSPIRGGIDSAIESALTAVLNQTAVELEMLGHLTGPAADDWLARRPRLRMQYAEALRWDCGMTKFLTDNVGPFHVLSAATSTWSSPFEMIGSMPAICGEWIFYDADMAANYRIQAELSDWLLGRGRPLVRPTRMWLSATGSSTAQQLVPILSMHLASEVEHRSRHVAVLVRREAIRQGSLPRDNADVFANKECGGWLEGGESAYWLAYERLSPTRFRVAVDPKRPLPAILAGLPKGPVWFDAAKPGAITHSALGQSADKELRLSLKGANTELVVPDFPPKQVPSVPGLPKPMPPAPEK